MFEIIHAILIEISEKWRLEIGNLETFYMDTE